MKIRSRSASDPPRRLFPGESPPEQNGLIERFFRSLKEERVWLQRFVDFQEVRRAIPAWIGWYNADRHHQALGYHSPLQFRAEQTQHVA
jgi:putative transposase